MIFLSSCTPIKHPNKTPFMKKLTQNLTPKKKIAKFSNLKMKMRLKIKIFPCKLYPFNIDVCFKHQNISCILLKNVYIIQI